VTPPRIDVLPPLPPTVYARRPAERLPFPLEEPNCRLYARGRHGLRQGLRPLGLEPGDEILTPAYHHGSEVEALIDAGLRCAYYDVGDTLAPDAAELDALVSERTRALYLIHYLGFPQDAPRWRAWCDERGLLLIEDAAEAWLTSIDGRPVGSFGDLAIFCLYSTYGLTDGAALISSAPPDPPRGHSRRGLRRLARRHGRWLAARSGVVAHAVARRQRPYHPERDYALGDSSTPPAMTSMPLLARLATRDAAALRRANYAALLAELGPHVPPALRHVPAGSSPHAFPIETTAGPMVVAELASMGVRAFRYWSLPHSSVPAGEFPGAARWRSRIVVLPVHQELRPADVGRVTTAARRALAGRRDVSVAGAAAQIAPRDGSSAASVRTSVSPTR
jgi:dTDP-4-amino-4,6-dideoxygalactose transaminase